MTQPMSVEAMVLHAVIDGDTDRAYELLSDFFDGEVASLRQSAIRLYRLCDEVLDRRVRTERKQAREAALETKS